MDERYMLTVEREIAGPIDAVFNAWLDAATMARWMTPAPDISVEAASDPVVGGRFRVVMKGRGQEIVHVGEYLVIERPRAWCSRGRASRQATPSSRWNSRA